MYRKKSQPQKGGEKHMFNIRMKLQSQREGGTLYAKTYISIKRQGGETRSKPNTIQALRIYLGK